jgi:hypothetical protein
MLESKGYVCSCRRQAKRARDHIPSNLMNWTDRTRHLYPRLAPVIVYFFISNINRIQQFVLLGTQVGALIRYNVIMLV